MSTVEPTTPTQMDGDGRESLGATQAHIVLLIKSELAATYARVVKDLRIFAVLSFAAGIFYTAVFTSLCLVIFGVMVLVGATIQALAIAAIVIGVIVLAAVGLAVAKYMNQEFWMKTFKIEEMIRNLRGN